MIDKNKIFNLFVDGKEITDEKTKKKIRQFMEGPVAKLGMFVKLIQNHQLFHDKLEKFLKHEDKWFEQCTKASEIMGDKSEEKFNIQIKALEKKYEKK